MAIVTTQQLNAYLSLYQEIDVSFTKEVTRILNFLQDQVYLKILGTQNPCVLFSSSLKSAKVIINLSAEQLEKLQSSSNAGTLRYGFRLAEKGEPMTFFVNVRVKGLTRYESANRSDLYFVNLEFTHRPPDNLIEILGGFLEANVNSHKRKDERIPVSEDIIKKVGFVSCSATVVIDSEERKCLVRDLSFGGSSLVVPGTGLDWEGKKVALKLVVEESGSTISIVGAFVHVEAVSGHKDLFSCGVVFDANTVPQVFKIKINDFLKQWKKPNQA